MPLTARSPTAHEPVLALVLLLVVSACKPDVPTSPSLAQLPDGSVAVVTEASSYVLQETASGWSLEMPFRFHNLSNERISLLNCHRMYGVILQKREGDEWVAAWMPILPMCLSAPIEIAPGAVLADTLRLFAGRPGSNQYPQFEVGEIDGTYRLVIASAFWNYDHDGPPWGEAVPLEYRVSAPIEIRRPGS